MRTALKRWLLGWLAWTVLALLSASQWAVNLGADGRPVPWGTLIPNRLVDWYSCGLFTPLFFWLVRRYPIDRARWLRHLPLQLAVAGLASVGKFAIQRWVTLHLVGQPFPPLGIPLERGFISENMAIWCVLAAVHAIEFHHRVREREVLTARLQARLSEAQLDALASRLHPHFLFNTLQAISTLLYRDPAAADAMLGHLSTLLRRALARGQGHEVTLAEELALLDEYLAIVQARFGDRVRLRREVDETALTGLVPQLLLQPLVENAVEHGVARRAGSGEITIRAAREGGTLRIAVADDGPGLERPAQEGVGLGSTRLRLGELYGAAGSLALGPGPEGGLVAMVTLPFHETQAMPPGIEAA
jgi:two-component system, LytTR family, sensor kinase